jgi:glycosyltransferase involved in cell wall biosynthesis
MKIAILIDGLYRGGAERQALNATLELTRSGHDIELLYYHAGGAVRSYTDHSAHTESRVSCIPKRKGGVPFIFRLRKYLKQGEFDVLHAFKAGPSVYAALAGRLAGVPVVLGGYRVEYAERGWTPIFHRLASYFLDGWIVNSAAIGRSLTKAIGVRQNKIFVVYNGLDVEAVRCGLGSSEAKVKLGLNADAPTISIIARLRPQKNHALFLEMAAEVVRRKPETKFLIVGDGELRSDLERQAKELSLDGKAIFLGNRTDIPVVLAATDVSMLTSHYEGMANAILESMAAGCVVVSTRYAGVEELISDGQNGVLVSLGDASGLANAAIRLLEDPELRERLARKGQQLVESEYSLQAMARNMAAVYEKCLRGKSRDG